jgi:hypothetical protein
MILALNKNHLRNSRIEGLTHAFDGGLIGAAAAYEPKVPLAVVLDWGKRSVRWKRVGRSAT